MADPVATTFRFSGSPAWVLLESTAFIGDHRRNHTTATGLTSFRCPVEVSFVPADPPEVTRWYVHCAGLKKKRFHGYPLILNAADSLVVVCMGFRRGGSCVFDHFVYRAGPGKPSLDLIPGSCPTITNPEQVGILPCGMGKHYSVVFPVPRVETQKVVYEIHVFSSENKAWRTKVASFSADPESSFHEMVMHDPSKAIVTGGSSLAWIDLWRGILLCNVLDENPVLRLIQWPVPLPGSDITDGSSACSFWDATLSNSVIRFVDIKFHDGGDAYNSWQLYAMNNHWTATIWERNTSSKYWNRCFKADIANILATHSSCSSLLQKVWDDMSNKLDLKKVLSATPILSLSNKDVVCFIVSLISNEGLLLLVNVREERLVAVEQASFELTCYPCTFSRFLDTCPGTDTANPLDKYTNKENVERLETYLLAAPEEHKDIEEHLEFQKPRRNKSMPLISSGPSSFLHANTEAVAEYGSVSGQNNSMSDVVDSLGECLRILGDLDSRTLTPIEAVKSKVSLALEALDRLMPKPV